MADPQVSTRIPVETVDAMKTLVDSKKYRSMTEFINEAIHEKLEREGMNERDALKRELIDLMKYDSDVRAVLNEISINNVLTFGK